MLPHGSATALQISSDVDILERAVDVLDVADLLALGRAGVCVESVTEHRIDLNSEK
jgi:hypothetical protein